MKFKAPIELLRKYLAGDATIEDVKKIDEWYSSFDKKEIDADPVVSSPETKEKIYQRIIEQLYMPAPVVPFYKRTYFRLSAAAILIFLIVSSYFFFQSSAGKKPDLANTANKSDVAPPVNNKAVLTLADGTKIDLDNSENGTLAVQGKINVIKKSDGQITYDGIPAENAGFNTLFVPRGSKPMHLILADGTEVWLNVASSITYPAAFTGNERKVEITGEAYFEVAKNTKMPFIVKNKNEGSEIKVLGTHFNVNGYDDEQAMKVTLLEGSVDVSAKGSHSVLKPGEQAQVKESIKVVNDADMEEVMAWKNGRFFFDGADIKAVMRQVEKWYDVEVTFKDEIPYSFVAKISRDVNVSNLFEILEHTELVHFKISGNKITVMK